MNGSASSIYDTTYKSTSSLVQVGNYGCSNQDITYNWSNYLTNDEFSGVKESFALAKSQGRWGVSVSYGAAVFFWTEDSSLYLDWMDSVYGGGYAVMAKGNNIHRAEFSLSGYYSPKPCVPYVSSYSTNASDGVVITDKFGHTKNLFVVTDYPNDPPGYEGTSPATSEPKAKYVALGDSFSSGEGLDSTLFESGTDVTGTDMCHRNSLAYPRLLEANTNLSLDLGSRFVACSGSHTSDILSDTSGNNVQNNEDAQINTLGSDTNIVTLTIGGNDIGFVDFGKACFFSYLTCNFSSPAYADALDKINNDLPTALEDTYDQILTATTASQAQIYVMGYPQVAPDKTAADPEDVRCPFFWDSGYDSTGTIPLYWKDAQAARDIVGRIDSHIEDLIWNMREDGGENLRLHYVEVNAPGSPFEGHEMCSTGDSYFQNLDQYPGNKAAMFHPNAEGQAAYAQLLADAISNQ